MKTVVITLLLFISAQGVSQNYEGTIGEYPVFFSLDAYDNGRASAVYFYKSSLHNISLEGNIKNGIIEVFERYSNIGENKELFRLTKQGTILQGNWVNGETTLPVNLTESDILPIDYKTSKFQFVRDSISEYGNKELVWFTEKMSGGSCFRLGNGFSQRNRDFFNTELDQMHTTYAESILACEYVESTFHVSHVSDKYISFKKQGSLFCGGAHPVHGTEGFNFDLTDQTVIDRPRDIYNKLDIEAALKAKYGINYGQEECEYFTFSSDIWEYSSWVLTPLGISITPNYPHAMTPCEEEFELSYKEIQQIIRKANR